MPLQALSSKDLSLPPKVGQVLTAPYSMSGWNMSIPNRAAPSTLSGMSVRGCELPMTVYCATFFKGGSCGTGMLAASRAILPKEHFRPLGAWMMRLSSTEQSVADTFQLCAAACVNMMRAAAPIRRSSVYQPRTETLPTVACNPNIGLLKIAAAGASELANRFQHPPSS